MDRRSLIVGTAAVTVAFVMPADAGIGGLTDEATELIISQKVSEFEKLVPYLEQGFSLTRKKPADLTSRSIFSQGKRGVWYIGLDDAGTAIRCKNATEAMFLDTLSNLEDASYLEYRREKIDMEAVAFVFSIKGS